MNTLPEGITESDVCAASAALDIATGDGIADATGSKLNRLAKLFAEHREKASGVDTIEGVLIQAGDVKELDCVPGMALLIVQCFPADIRAAKTLPMYRRVRIVPIQETPKI